MPTYCVRFCGEGVGSFVRLVANRPTVLRFLSRVSGAVPVSPLQIVESLLLIRYSFFALPLVMHSSATRLRKQSQVLMYPAWPEDRATLGSDPSADWSPANGRSGGFHTKAARLAHCRCREKSDKSIFLLLHQIALTIGGTATTNSTHRTDNC